MTHSLKHVQGINMTETLPSMHTSHSSVMVRRAGAAAGVGAAAGTGVTAGAGAAAGAGSLGWGGAAEDAAVTTGGAAAAGVAALAVPVPRA